MLTARRRLACVGFRRSSPDKLRAVAIKSCAFKLQTASPLDGVKICTRNQAVNKHFEFTSRRDFGLASGRAAGRPTLLPAKIHRKRCSKMQALGIPGTVSSAAMIVSRYNQENEGDAITADCLNNSSR